MKPMTKAEFYEHLQVAKNAGLECRIGRKNHTVWLVRGEDMKRVAIGWDIDTSIRHENRFNGWMKTWQLTQ